MFQRKTSSRFRFPSPPLAEQQRIVGLLDEVFANLATAQAHAERNNQNARALFESHIQSVFTQHGKGWVEKNLGDLCQIKTGKKDVNEGNPEGKYPFFTCAAAHTYSDNYSFDTEALLVAGNGNVGQVSYYSGKFEAYQRTYVLFSFKDVTAKYLFRVLDKRLSATVSKKKLGNTMPYIKIGMLTDFVVPVPPPNEQETIAANLDEVAEETQRLATLYEGKLRRWWR
jgi:type I restriction enzyme S subunit